MMTHTVTCHTEGCENDGIGIELTFAADAVACGPCGVEITDVEPPIPPREPEPEPEPDPSPAE